MPIHYGNFGPLSNSFGNISLIASGHSVLVLGFGSSRKKVEHIHNIKSSFSYV